MDCPAFISLRASKCGQFLQVMQVCNQHNHEISEDAIKQTPHYRKLTPEVKEEVLYLLTANIHRDEIIKYVKLRAGVQLISKTINNFMLELKTQKKCVPNAAAFERIQRFLETTKTVLATNSDSSNSITPENGDIQKETDQMIQTVSGDALEPNIDNLIEVVYETMIENDPLLELNNLGCCAAMLQNVNTSGRVADVMIESIQQSETSKINKSPNGTRCETMVKCEELLHSEINRLRQNKRRLLREMCNLKWKKQKLTNQIIQLE